jgi:dolichyl-diphosphooligosaccharide--protein glycosyltransferase
LFRHVQSLKTKVILTSSFFALVVAAFFLAGELGFLGTTPSKFIGVLNPLLRTTNPIVESVAEHRPGAWASLYYEYGIGAFFIPVGLFFALRNPTDRNVFLAIFTLTTIYFASSMIRLTLLMAPAFCILWAVALVHLLRPFVTVMKEAPVIPRRKMRFEAHVGKEFSAALLILMLILLIFPFHLPDSRAINHAYSPVTIASASAPIRPSETVTDWLDTLEWMRVNLHSTDVVCSWWDYGYWITILGNQTTLADNGTINTTQIGTIGLMFMSNETEAIKILKGYDVTHVVVFTTFYVSSGQVVELGWGDEGKWHWMFRIAKSVYPTDPRLKEELDYGKWDNQTGRWQWNENGTNTVIYKLMHYGAEKKALGSSTITLEHFKEAYFSKADPSRTGNVYVLVCVYEVIY